jgi:hypothetical protein
MEEEILEYLAQFDRATPVSINHMLIAKWPGWDQGVNEHITYLLQALVNRKFIKIENDQHTKLGTQKQPGQLCTLDTDQILCSITYDGLKELERIRFQRDLLQVNQSVILTNQSFKNLNEEVIPKYSEIQRRVGNKTLLIAALSAVFLMVSVYYVKKGVTSKDIESLNKQLQKDTQLLDSIRQHQKGIDESLKKAIKDSFYVHHH